MTVKSPLWLEDLDYSATDMRRLLAEAFPLPGCFGDADLKVVQHGSGAMSVDVNAGGSIIAGTTLSGQGSYLFGSDATVNVEISGAPGAGESRIDAIVAKIQDQDSDGGADNDGVIVAVAGTAASTGSEIPPTVPDSCDVLAHVIVGPGVTEILTANITDMRTFAHGKDTFIGEVKMLAVPTLPGAGWEWVDGSAVSRSVYAAAFAAMGTTWGDGDGSATFNKPDLVDFFPVGAGDAYELGGTGGEAAHTLTTAELASHGHGLDDPGHGHLTYVGEEGEGYQGVFTMGTEDGNVYAIPETGNAGDGSLIVESSDSLHWQSAETGATVEDAGDGDAHNNLPPYKGVNFAICMR